MEVDNRCTAATAMICRLWTFSELYFLDQSEYIWVESTGEGFIGYHIRSNFLKVLFQWGLNACGQVNYVHVSYAL